MARGHHHRESGGGVPMEDRERGMSYTGKNNVEKEAGGEERRDGGRSEHRGKHHVAHNAGHEKVEHHHHADGGVVALKDGGRSEHAGKHHVAHNAEHGAVHHHHYRKGGHVPDMAEEHADGGAVGFADGGHVKRKKKEVEGEGHKMKNRRLDRPGRKRGGGVGADTTPLSSAATTRQAGAHSAENDELSRKSGGRSLC